MPFMIRKHKLEFIILTLYAIGLILHLQCFFRTYALWLTSPFLIFINGLVLVRLYKNAKKVHYKKISVFLLVSFVFTLALEAIGTKTGAIFGEYVYGQSMMLKIANVPFVIGLNWVVLLIASYNFSFKILSYYNIRSVFVEVILTAGLLTFLDYFIEPVAVFLDYWKWSSNIIPLQNYLAWFIISALLVVAIKLFRIDLRNRLLVFYYPVVLVYFITLNIFLQTC